MKIYEASYASAGEGMCVAWGRTKTDAREKIYAVMCNDSTDNEGTPLRSIEVRAHKIAPNAAALADWLNLYFTRDNG